MLNWFQSKSCFSQRVTTIVELEMITKEDAGKYSCIAQNELGEASASAWLIIGTSHTSQHVSHTSQHVSHTSQVRHRTCHKRHTVPE